jgi:N-acetyl-1-D-myo-inositol-2-amino-2-deoxy-alpha-D-glucopyranoside deacetylase
VEPREPAVLIVFAHPDDEAFGLGGTIAALAARGTAVHILLATRGEAGAIADPSLDTSEIRANLPGIREAEARQAAEVLGARTVEFLGYPDGALADADAGELTRRIAGVMRRVRPDVVMTFGPEGIYGHPDHVTVGEVTTEAFRLAAEATVELPQLEPFSAARLFYHVLTAEAAARLNAERGPVELSGHVLRFVGYAEGEITTRIDIGAFLEVKLAALACHRTQTGGQMEAIRRLIADGPPYEHLIQARSRVPDVPALAGDPLAGLR